MRTYDQWKTEPDEDEREIDLPCTGDYASCRCAACDQGRADIEADRRCDEQREKSWKIWGLHDHFDMGHCLENVEDAI